MLFMLITIMIMRVLPYKMTYYYFIDNYRRNITTCTFIIIGHYNKQNILADN